MDIKLFKSTILGSITRVNHVEYIENVCSNTMQSISDKAHDETQLNQQVKPLLLVFPDQSSFQTHAYDNSKSVIQLQDANLPPVIQHKLNTTLNNEFTCIISKSSTDFRGTT